jgi:hypothetical protein
MNTFTPLSFAFICADKLLHMLIRFTFSNPFDWYIITIYKYSFSVNIFSKYFWTIYFIVSKNHGKYAFFNKMSFFSETKQLTVRKILDLFTTNEAILNVRLKFSKCSLLFFSIFFFKRYNTGRIHAYISISSTHHKIFLSQYWVVRILSIVTYM